MRRAGQRHFTPKTLRAGPGLVSRVPQPRRPSDTKHPCPCLFGCNSGDRPEPNYPQTGRMGLAIAEVKSTWIEPVDREPVWIAGRKREISSFRGSFHCFEASWVVPVSQEGVSGPTHLFNNRFCPVGVRTSMADSPWGPGTLRGWSESTLPVAMSHLPFDSAHRRDRNDNNNDIHGSSRGGSPLGRKAPPLQENHRNRDRTKSSIARR